MDDDEKRTDEFKDIDLKANLHNSFEQLSANLTKPYAFFYDAPWEPKDSRYLTREREEVIK